MDKKTYVYLIRHSEQLKIENNEENSQIANEKIILSINGEKKAEELSNIKELQNIDVVYSSQYTRALATAKYIADKNNKEIKISCDLGERKLGDLDELEKLGETRKNSYTVEQMIDENLKTSNGESRKEVTERMEEKLNEVFKENIGRKVVVVSHGAAIKFLLMKWCKLNEANNLEYNNREIVLNSPGLIKLTFLDNALQDIQQII